jgi:proteasome accessory factor C
LSTQTAAEQLRRVLAVVPRLADGEEHPIAEVAQMAGVDERTLMGDLEALAFRHDEPAGFVEGLQLYLDSESVSVVSKHFLRPMRLTLQEMHALELGLSMLRLERPVEEHAAVDRTRERLRDAMVATQEEEGPGGYQLGDISVPGHEEHLATFREALRSQRKVELTYQSSGAAEPRTRTVAPYGFVYASGMWYMVAHCGDSEGLRVFRLDRVRDVELGAQEYEVPGDFNVRAFVAEPRAFRWEGTEHMRVRYSPRVARWIAEREGLQPSADGSLTVDHPLADREWGIRHVLQYGPDAEVLEPAELRDAIVSRLRQAASRSG